MNDERSGVHTSVNAARMSACATRASCEDRCQLDPYLGGDCFWRAVAVDQTEALRFVASQCVIGFANLVMKFDGLLFEARLRASARLRPRQSRFAIDVDAKGDIGSQAVTRNTIEIEHRFRS